jgi:hypothetical protein
MKLVTYRSNNNVTIGAVVGDFVLDLNAAFKVHLGVRSRELRSSI